MNATPVLKAVLAAMQRLKAVMIGNAAAALHGAPVTTLDVDFMFRDTPTNLRKRKFVAKSLKAFILSVLEQTLHEKTKKTGSR
jgi:hypothetical protein